MTFASLPSGCQRSRCSPPDGVYSHRCTNVVALPFSRQASRSATIIHLDLDHRCATAASSSALTFFYPSPQSKLGTMTNSTSSSQPAKNKKEHHALSKYNLVEQRSYACGQIGHQFILSGQKTYLHLLAMAKYKDLWRGGGATNRSAHEEVEGGATTRCAQGGPE